MSSDKEDKQTEQTKQQQPEFNKKNVSQSSSSKQQSSSDKAKDIEMNNDSQPSSEEQDGQAKKGFSILNSLAKYMSREKSDSIPIIEPLPENESDVGQQLQPMTATEYNDVSSQTSAISVHRSSTLTAISKAVDALKEVRRRVAVIPKKDGDNMEESLQPEGTQTSSYVLYDDDSDSSLHRNPDLLTKNRSLPSFSTDETDFSREHFTTGSVPNFENLSETTSQVGPRSTSEGDLKRHRKVNQQPEHVYFRKHHEHRGMSARKTHAWKSKTASGAHFSNDDDDDDESPKPGKGKQNKQTRQRPFKNANIQTERQFEPGKGTQTSSTSTRSMNNHNDHDRRGERNKITDNSSADINTLARRLLADRGKCSKCDLFELMFIHGGEKILNDKEIIGMFKRHMNKHLLKAQEELAKYEKKPRKKAEAQHLHDALSLQQLTSNQHLPRPSETSFQNDRTEKNSEPEVYKIGSHTVIEIKHETGKTPIKRDHEARSSKDTKGKSDSDNPLETKENERDQDKRRNSRDRSPSCDRLFKKYLLAKIGVECSDEAIIKRKNCHRNCHNRCADFQNDCDDGGHYNSKNDKNEDMSKRNCRGFDKESFYVDWGNHRDYCERDRCRRVSDVNTCKYWRDLCNNDDECNYQCDDDECPCPCYSDHCDGLSGAERQLKCLVKGMLRALKGHHDVKSTESNTNIRKSGSPSNLNKNGKDEKNETRPEAASKSRDEKPGDTLSSSTSPKKGRSRHGSILSDIAFAMVKDAGTKEKPTDIEKKEKVSNSNSDKQDITEKELHSEASNLSLENKLAAEVLANWIQKAKSKDDDKATSGIKNKHFDLEDPKVQDFVKSIIRVIRPEILSSDHEESLPENECEDEEDAAGDDPLSCVSSTDYLVEKVCSLLMKAAAPKNSARPPAAPTCPFPFSNSTRGGGRTTSERASCSCCNRHCNPYANCSEYSYCDWLGGEPFCCGESRPCTHRNYCNFSSSQEASKRNNANACNRAKMRQQCADRCKRERETLSQRRRPPHVHATRIANCSRPTTRENPLAACNILTNPANNLAGNTCQPFTYVVPQNRTFWQE